MYCHAKVNCYNLYIHFKTFWYTPITQMPSLSHKKRCVWELQHSKWTKHFLYFSTQHMFNSNNLLQLFFKFFNNVQVSLKLPRSRECAQKATICCKFCWEDFTACHVLRKNSSSHRQSLLNSDLDMDTFFENTELKEEQNYCKHLLVDSASEKSKQSVSSFAVSSFNNCFLSVRLDHLYRQLKRAAQVNLHFGY